MNLQDLGWDDAWAAAAAAIDPGLAPARIAVEHRGAYQALDDGGELRWVELRGKDYFAAADKRALPTVGDWVLTAGAVIHAILPRRSCVVRAAAGEKVMPQPIAANVDVAFIVTSANLDLNVRRVERYLATVQASGAAAVIVLNKIDLVDDPAPLRDKLAAMGAPVIATSAARGDGVEEVRARLGRGTGVVIGSSGVGKSTLLEHLIGQALPTAAVRPHDDRGRHTTTRRELFVLAGGGVIIDTPGMRELKLWSEADPAGADDQLAFDDVTALAAQCKFADCRHVAEPGCAVVAAVKAGALPADRLDAYRKLAGEQVREADRRDHAERRRGKVGSKLLRARLKEKDK